MSHSENGLEKENEIDFFFSLSFRIIMYNLVSKLNILVSIYI